MSNLVHLQALAKEAADHNITWGLEVVNRYVSNILNTAQQVGASCMQQQLDIKRTNAAGGSVLLVDGAHAPSCCACMHACDVHGAHTAGQLQGIQGWPRETLC